MDLLEAMKEAKESPGKEFVSADPECKEYGITLKYNKETEWTITTAQKSRGSAMRRFANNKIFVPDDYWYETI